MNGNDRKAYNIFNFNFTGSEVDYPVEFPGALILHHRGTVDLLVKLDSPSNDAIPIGPKDQINFPFTRFFVTPQSAGSVTFFISGDLNINLFGQRVSVDVINQVLRDDSWSYWTDQKKAFMGYVNVSGVAAQYSHAQLKNPLASGKIVRLHQITYKALIGAPIYLRNYASNLTNAALTHTNCFLGEASPVALLKYSNSATLLGTDFSFHSTELGTGAVDGKMIPIKFANPIRIGEGNAIVIVNGLANSQLLCNLDWTEE